MSELIKRPDEFYVGFKNQGGGKTSITFAGAPPVENARIVGFI